MAMYDSDNTRDNYINSDEIISAAIRGLKTFLDERLEKVASFKVPGIDEKQVKKIASSANEKEISNFINKDAVEYGMKCGHKLGYISAIEDIKNTLKRMGI